MRLRLKGDGDEFPAGETTFASEVTGARRRPDAIVILAFDETKSIVPELAAPGSDMSKTYFADGNTADYSEDFQPGTLEGAQGTIPGADPRQTSRTACRLVRVGPGEALKDFSYAAESYDATILAALAAIKGGDTDGDHPEELRGGLGRHRRREVHHLHRLRRPARRRQGDPLHRSVRHRPDRRRERPVLGVRRHLHLRRRQQQHAHQHGRGRES